MIKINGFDLGGGNPQNGCKIKGTSFLYYYYKTCFFNKRLQQLPYDLHVLGTANQGHAPLDISCMQRAHACNISRGTDSAFCYRPNAASWYFLAGTLECHA